MLAMTACGGNDKEEAKNTPNPEDDGIKAAELEYKILLSETLEAHDNAEVEFNAFREACIDKYSNDSFARKKFNVAYKRKYAELQAKYEDEIAEMELKRFENYALSFYPEEAIEEIEEF